MSELASPTRRERHLLPIWRVLLVTISSVAWFLYLAPHPPMFLIGLVVMANFFIFAPIAILACLWLRDRIGCWLLLASEIAFLVALRFIG